MTIVAYIMLFIFGTFFGSFASVLIHRLKSKESGIMFGRSHCPKCNHTLNFYDLFPIFSYISTLGKCRYCKEKISIIYPILEISTGLLFFLVGYKLVDMNLVLMLNDLEILKLVYFLFLAFITILFIFYDILFLEINEGILLTGIIISTIFILFQSINPEYHIINTLNVGEIGLTGADLWLSSLMLLLTISFLYVIMLKGLKEIYDILILLILIFGVLYLKNILNIDIYNTPIISSILGILLIFTFLFFQIVISKGTWMGGGDLRIAILLGLILGSTYSFAGIMLTYIVGSFIGIFIIAIQKIQKKDTLNTMIPFGPFLGIGLFVCLLWQDEVNKLLYYYL